jgi:chromosome segregation ATPase
MSINELRQQIQKLTSIANDPKTDPEVRNFNRRFLEERRSKLVTLLKEKLTTLQSYQAKVSDLLSDAEKQQPNHSSLRDNSCKSGGEFCLSFAGKQRYCF